MSGTVLYDSECALCNSQVRFIRRRDRRKSFRFVALQSEEGRSMLHAAGLPTDELDTVVYAKEGKHLVRSSAVLGILDDLGGGWQLLKFSGIIPAPIRDFFYRLVARNRHRLTPRKRS
ncbi:MAG: DCC1-like thiol-disulfide oxidoreductase family protein [Bacteroidales bacterium]|nr:DCC1-like thiol-disulfide oxidoreductase family protein [Bacteroidales bacterium]